jgi:hypothetical protein
VSKQSLKILIWQCAITIPPSNTFFFELPNIVAKFLDCKSYTTANYQTINYLAERVDERMQNIGESLPNSVDKMAENDGPTSKVVRLPLFVYNHGIGSDRIRPEEYLANVAAPC